MNQYAIYLRKSRADLDAEARGEGETLSKHRKALTAFAQKRGLLIVREYAEIISGDSIAARPQMQQLLSDVKAGMYSGVIVNDIDRLGRGDSIDQEIIKLTFAASGTLIITPNKDIDPANASDQDMLDFSMFFARFEYRKIGQRLSVGRHRSAASGNFVASRVPYGYERVYVDGRPTLQPNPDRAPIVKMIFDWYMSGDGYTAIITRLLDMGIKTAKGVPFNQVAVRRILVNPVYTGAIVFGRTRQISVVENGARKKRLVPTGSPTIVPNSHEAIITQDTFDAVQRKLKSGDHARPVNTKYELKNPLAGLIRCSICGHTMVIHQRGENREPYFRCMTPRCKTSCSPLRAVESSLLEVMRNYSASYVQPSEEPEDTTDKRTALNKQIDALTSRLSRARELVETGIYTPQEYISQRDDLTAKIEATRTEIEGLSKPRPIPVSVAEIERVIDAYTLAESAADKNALLKSVIDHVVYHKAGAGRKNHPTAMILDLYPKMV